MPDCDNATIRDEPQDYCMNEDLFAKHAQLILLKGTPEWFTRGHCQ